MNETPPISINPTMNVLIGCEESGTVRDAFAALGHKVLSCDLQPTRTNGPHYQGDIFDVIDYPWDLAIFHPPCTHTSVSGAKHFAEKWQDGRQAAGVAFLCSWYEDRPTYREHVSNSPFPSCRRCTENLIRSFNRGSSDTVKPRQPACGLKICRSYRRLT